jgi:hypothetical protein
MMPCTAIPAAEIQTVFLNTDRAIYFIMNRISGLVIAVLVILTAGVLSAGCTNSAPVNTTSGPTAAATITPSTAPLYTTGDIVRSPKADAGTGYLILRYIPGSDSYERAFIYRNTDGSWGYRVDSRTETLGRQVLEKVNTVKVTHVDPSLVTLKQPTPAGQTVTATTTSSGSVTSPTVTTSTPAIKPQIKDITPDNGRVGTSVSVTDLQGNGFQSGATVTLARFGSENISATNVNVLSASRISCTFSLPVDATIGIWDLIVSNPDGQSTRYSNVFTVRVNPGVTASTTSSSTGGIEITSIDPVFSSASGTYLPVTVFGSNFKDGITCELTRSGKSDIHASTVSRASDSQMQCFFSLPAGSNGAWNLVLTNTDGTTGTLTNGFTVNS